MEFKRLMGISNLELYITGACVYVCIHVRGGEAYHNCIIEAGLLVKTSIYAILTHIFVQDK